MNRSKLNQWLKLIQSTQPEEISCSECFDYVSTYVDLEIAGKPARTLMPELKQHIDQCRVCREEYELIHDLAQAEAAGEPPEVDELRRAVQNRQKDES